MPETYVVHCLAPETPQTELEDRRTLCKFVDAPPVDWPPEHLAVCVLHAFDPDILKITCSECAALVLTHLQHLQE